MQLAENSQHSTMFCCKVPVFYTFHFADLTGHEQLYMQLKLSILFVCFFSFKTEGDHFYNTVKSMAAPKMRNAAARSLIDFINKSPSPWHGK